MQRTAIAKVAAAAEYVMDLVEGGGKVRYPIGCTEIRVGACKPSAQSPESSRNCVVYTHV